MYQPQTINLIKFLMAFSDTLDLASPLLAQHQLRTAHIAWKLGEAARLEPAALETVLLAALLHDIGALTPEDKIAIHESESLHGLEAHCILGEQVLREVPLFAPAAPVVRRHHTAWREWEGADGDPHARAAQIIFLADTAERAIDRERYILFQDEAIVERIRALAGSEFDPELVELFRGVAAREEFWLDLVSPKLAERFLEGPGAGRAIPQEELQTLSEMIRNVIDFRSHFTAAHSAGVASAASLLAGFIGCPSGEVELMKLVGNLHDVGKMAVPNAILEKPDKLSRDEYAIMRQHTYHTYAFLQRCGFSPNVVEWAGFHHERLDGTGYPFHLDAARISLGSRIVAAADVLIAVAEDRPYRAGMPKRDVISVLTAMGARGKLDPNVVEMLRSHYDEIIEPTFAVQRAACARYEANFMAKAAEKA